MCMCSFQLLELQCCGKKIPGLSMASCNLRKQVQPYNVHSKISNERRCVALVPPAEYAAATYHTHCSHDGAPSARASSGMRGAERPRAKGMITSGARLAVRLLHRAGLAQVTAPTHLSWAAQAARWRAGALLSGAHAQRSAPGSITPGARLVVRLLRRAGLGPASVLMHLSCAAQAACQPQRICSRALSGRRPRSVPLAPGGTSAPGRPCGCRAAPNSGR